MTFLEGGVGIKVLHMSISITRGHFFLDRILMHLWWGFIILHFVSSEFFEGLSILKHDFSIFDDSDFEDVGTTWRKWWGYWWLRPIVSFPLAHAGFTFESFRLRLLLPRDRVRLLLRYL
jgi:hypothetical protein